MKYGEARNQPIVAGIEVTTSYYLEPGASLESSADGVFCYRRQDAPSYQQLEHELGRWERGTLQFACLNVYDFKYRTCCVLFKWVECFMGCFGIL
jgi:hypothetical protein